MRATPDDRVNDDDSNDDRLNDADGDDDDDQERRHDADNDDNDDNEERRHNADERRHNADDQEHWIDDADAADRLDERRLDNDDTDDDARRLIIVVEHDHDTRQRRRHDGDDRRRPAARAGHDPREALQRGHVASRRRQFGAVPAHHCAQHLKMNFSEREFVAKRSPVSKQKVISSVMIEIFFDFFRSR